MQTYYLYDGLGSTTDLIDGSGTSIDSYGYDVFGAIRTQSGSSSNYWLFTGEQRDGTGLQYLRARYYDPETGRFITQDPLPFVNRYAYVRNNPVRYVDPYGLFGLGDLNPFDDIVDCVKNPKECAEKAAEGIKKGAEAVGGAVADVWPYVSTEVQIVDVLPLANVPIVGQLAGEILDIGAAIALQIDIFRSDCPWQPLTLANLANLGTGTLGNLGSFLTVNQASLIEAVNFGATAAFMEGCGSVAYSSGSTGNQSSLTQYPWWIAEPWMSGAWSQGGHGGKE